MFPFGTPAHMCVVLPGNEDRWNRLGGVLCLGFTASPSSTCLLGPAGGIPSYLGLVFGEDSIIGNCKSKLKSK
jgi:hypothetical protein